MGFSSGGEAHAREDPDSSKGDQDALDAATQKYVWKAPREIGLFRRASTRQDDMLFLQHQK